MSHRTISLTDASFRAWTQLQAKGINCSEVCQDALVARAAGIPDVRRLALDHSARTVARAATELEDAKEADAALRNQLAVDQLADELQHEETATRERDVAMARLKAWPGYADGKPLIGTGWPEHELKMLMLVAVDEKYPRGGS